MILPVHVSIATINGPVRIVLSVDGNSVAELSPDQCKHFRYVLECAERKAADLTPSGRDR